MMAAKTTGTPGHVRSWDDPSAALTGTKEGLCQDDQNVHNNLVNCIIGVNGKWVSMQHTKVKSYNKKKTNHFIELGFVGNEQQQDPSWASRVATRFVYSGYLAQHSNQTFFQHFFVHAKVIINFLVLLQWMPYITISYSRVQTGSAVWINYILKRPLILRHVSLSNFSTTVGSTMYFFMSH